MPETTVLPDAVTLGVHATGAYTDIDEGVASHNGNIDYIQLTSVGSSVVIDFASPSGTPPYTRICFRAVVSNSSGVQYVTVTATLLIDGAAVNEATIDMLSGTGFGIISVCTAVSSYTQAQANGASLRIRISSAKEGGVTDLEDPSIAAAASARVTAADMTVEWADATGLSFAEGVIFGDVWTVAGAGAANSPTWSDTVQFADTWAVTRTAGGGSGDIVPGPSDNPAARTNLACRSCGSMTQVTESLIFYADGFASPVTWDGASASATTVSGAKLLPYVVAHRDRVWLFGEEPYVTGTVKTVAGVTQIEFSTAPPAGVLGKNIAISDVKFGPDSHCQSTIINVNGVLATLSTAPNFNYDAAKFIIFSGTAGSTLQWSDANDHTSWTDAVLPVGRLDGDIPTGIASVSGFVMLFKRSKTYRFDYGTDPNDTNDRALVVSSETRGLVAHRCCVVIEGTAYCMDQFGSGDGQAGWWITRGGALFPIEIGGDVSPVTASGETYQLDWSKSSCWFGVYEPQTNSVWWFCTKQGDNLPKVAFIYNRPQVEGGDESGRWMLAEFEHPCIAGVTAVGHDGVMRAYIVCADPNNEETLYLTALANAYGDMATSSQTGTVAKQVSGTVLDLGKHVTFHAGMLVEINGVKRTVKSDTGIQVTFSTTWGTTEVVDKTWRAGWKPKATFKTIYISPEPSYTTTTVSQCHALFIRGNTDAELRIGFESDGGVNWLPVLGGAADATGRFANYERLVSMNVGISGYEISMILELLSPGGADDMVHAVDILRHKRKYPASELPSEMP